MGIELKRPELTELSPRITVIGVGGAGGNAVNNMIKSGLQGVDFVVANTDAQALVGGLAETRIQLGLKITQGLGAGSRPEIGRAAAEETLDTIETALDGSHMCFITAGMGGGTGTGAAPIVARAAREKGILTVGVVTKPFSFEGLRRMRSAEEGISELQKHVDTLIIIPNQNLFRIAGPQTTFKEAFSMADEVLHAGVRGITDLMVMPGLINLDFADIRTVMSEMGKAMMGTGEAEGAGRAIEAAQAAIANPLLDEVSMRGAKGVIINITGGDDLTLFEVDEAANHIREMVDPEANIIVGSAFNEELNGRMRVSVVATGIDAAAATQPATPATSRTSMSFSPVAGAFHTGAPRAGAQPVAQPAPVAQPVPVAEPEAVAEEEDVLALDVADELAEPDAPAVVTSLREPAPRAPQTTAPIVESVERPFVEPARPAARPRAEATRAPTLFERMMGIGRSTQAEETDDVPAPAAKAAPARDPRAAGEDPLEIPTFLKRQAN
ncbi:cell division protein FtsZ [Parapedomonas caeni]